MLQFLYQLQRERIGKKNDVIGDDRFAMCFNARQFQHGQRQIYDIRLDR
jgi:hypothetical protein